MGTLYIYIMFLDSVEGWTDSVFLSYLRYQWSVGFTEKPSPEGLFNQATERIWHDAGQNMEQVYQTKQGVYDS